MRSHSAIVGDLKLEPSLSLCYWKSHTVHSVKKSPRKRSKCLRKVIEDDFLFLLSELRKQIGLNNCAVGRQSKQNGYLMPPACLLSAAAVTACEADRHSQACSFTGCSDSFWSVKRPALAARRQDSQCLPVLGICPLQLILSLYGGGGIGTRFP